MPAPPSGKILTVAVLLGAALLGPTDWLTAGLLLFGLANVLVAPPGTARVRAVAVLACLVLLMLGSGDVRLILVMLMLSIWPPVFMLAWAAADRTGPENDAALRAGPPGGQRARVSLAAIIVSVAIASIAYRVIVGHGLQQTAALFVGLPALLAIVVVFAVSPRSATGVACKAVTVGLLVSLLFLGEGILCIVMSAPLFYAVAVAVGLAADAARRRARAGRSGHTAVSCLAVLLVAPMSLEGVTGATALNRDEWVTETRIVHASVEAVERAMSGTPRFERAVPAYLRLGFPRPVAVRIDRAGPRPQWVVRFRGGEMRLDGVEPRAGDLTLQLEERRPGLARWRALSDDSHMTHFLDWREAIVRWETAGRNVTRVTWTLRYRRGLDPAWYFGPWERYAVRLAAAYLIESVATP
jgi:hypothetical protein